MTRYVTATQSLSEIRGIQRAYNRGQNPSALLALEKWCEDVPRISGHCRSEPEWLEARKIYIGLYPFAIKEALKAPENSPLSRIKLRSTI